MAKKPQPPDRLTTIQIFDFEQGSEEWFKVRLGVPTASNFSKIMAQTADQKGRARLLRDLAGEIITRVPAENYKNSSMERGTLMEAELRAKYADSTFDEITQVGFVRNGKYGCSPDCFVGREGMAEFKSMIPALMIELIERGAPLPGDHRAQVQGNLMVTERKWCDLVIGYTGMPQLKWRVQRDEPYIEQLRGQLEIFDLDLRRLVERVRALENQ